MSVGEQFEKLALSRYTTVVRRISEEATVIVAQRVRRELNEKLVAFFFQDVANLRLKGRFSAYSENYEVEKAQGNPGWMDLHGDTMGFLLAANPLRLYGGVDVVVRALRGSSLRPGIRLDSLGRPQYERGMRPAGVRGGFVNFVQAYEDAQMRIEVQLWPDMTQMRDIFEAFPDTPLPGKRLRKRVGNFVDTAARTSIRERAMFFEYGRKNQPVRPIFATALATIRAQKIPEMLPRIVGL